MAYEHPGGATLDYQLCRYGASRLLCRGPKERLAPPYTVFFGGSETFGRFVPAPFPVLLAQRLGLTSVNFGCLNAGVDVFADDAALIAAAARAERCVIQVVGAQNLSNRFYTVHPRRNDRFVAPTCDLRRLYPEVDFTEFSFTRHLLTTLERTCQSRFDTVVQSLQEQWLVQMRRLIRGCGEATVLLWVGDNPPPETARRIENAPDPLLVDARMMADLAAEVDDVVTVVPSRTARTMAKAGMVYTDFEAHIAAEAPGPAVHGEIAEALHPILARLRTAA